MVATTEQEIYKIIEQVMDPEVPVLSVVELGIVRGVKVEEELTRITITPTYSGCPAMNVIEFEIVKALEQAGVEKFHIETILSPPWTTDWISDSGLQKLKDYGIAPPEKTHSDKGQLSIFQKEVNCPQCNSDKTELVSQFGSTACKAQYKCLDCLEPFDYFKCF
jgi:ring-1,2-phenylacetyl-CoA epoxidase subunit PaaD